jgi:hypothetical protein
MTVGVRELTVTTRKRSATRVPSDTLVRTVLVFLRACCRLRTLEQNQGST